MRIGFLRATLGALALIMVAQAAHAGAPFVMSAGPYVDMKVGANAVTPQTGRKTGVVVDPLGDIGASLLIPLSRTEAVGATVDLGYSTFSILDKPFTDANDNNTFVTHYHYFALSPNLVASVFKIGFTFGIPTGATTALLSGSSSKDASTSDLQTVVDVHLGAMVPLVVSQTGRFNLTIDACYLLTGMDVIPSGQPTQYNPHAAALSIGLNYLFALSHD